MKKNNVGIIMGLGIGFLAAIYLAEKKQTKYFDKHTIAHGVKKADRFIGMLSQMAINDGQVEQRIDYLIKEFFIKQDGYQTYAHQLMTYLNKQHVTISSVEGVHECLYLCYARGMVVNGESFEGYQLERPQGRVLCDLLQPSKQEQLKYARLKEGIYQGCYGLVLSIKVNNTDWYLRMAYVDYEFKILSMGMMNQKMKSILK